MSEEKKRYNPSIGGGFTNAKFGEDSILVNIDAAGLDTIMKNVQVGGAILLRYNKVTSKGNKHYFAEILPPFEGGNRPQSAGKVAPAGDLD